ncbi:MAG TPA: DNA alkylation repair protein [Thermoplasmata archaeon]
MPASLRAAEIIAELRSKANPANVEGMARFGISPEGTLGVSVPTLRRMAKKIRKDHALAQELWSSGIHEARMMAAFVDDPASVTEAQMESWVKEFDSWDVCDQVCSNLFDATPFAYSKAALWSKRDEEFVKRAGFVLMAALSVHDKKVDDKEFLRFLPIIKREAWDERNFVKKAVNWALRQIGKRNLALNRAALAAAREIHKQGTRSARWIASDAIRELSDETVLRRLKDKQLRKMGKAK